MGYTSIAAIKAANSAAGQHFFDPGAMRFFKSKVDTFIFGERFFVTSEQGPNDVRRYSVREAKFDGSIDTIGEFQAYDSLTKARIAAASAFDPVGSCR